MRAARASAVALATLTAAIVPGFAADACRGERAFQKCYACHSVKPGEGGLPGPNLAGIVGRRAGADASFEYSPALAARAAAGLAWTDAALDAFLADPLGWLPGTSMNFVGLGDAGERADLIAYLRNVR